MTLKTFSVNSATALDLSFFADTPICVIHGRYSDLVLDLMRESIGDHGAILDPDRIDDGRFVIHADILMDNKSYSACYIRGADCLGDNRLAVNFEGKGLNFSGDDTLEYISKCNERNRDASNVLIDSINVNVDDDRPVFIYGYFDKLDEAVDIEEMIDYLASTKKQIFVSVCKGYSIERLINKSVKVICAE